MKISPSLQVATACLLWAFSALTRKLVLVSISPILLNLLNALFAIILVSAYSKPNFTKLFKIFTENKLLFILNSFFGVTLGLSFAYFSLERIDLSLYGLLIKLQPVFVILLAYFFLNEKLSIKKIPWIIMAIISSFLLSYSEDLIFSNDKLLGIAAAILTALSLSISTITGKALITKGLTPDQTTIIRFFLGGILLTPALLLEPLVKTEAIPLTIIALLGFGILCNVFAFILYYKGLKNLEAVKATILELIMPVLTVFFGFAFLGETLTGLQILASMLLLCCILKLESIYLEQKSQEL